MPYIDRGPAHDADARIMETAEFLAAFGSERVTQHTLGIDGIGRLADFGRTRATAEAGLAA